MTILGNHTVGETRDFIRAAEYRINKNVQQWQRIKSFRLRPPTAAEDAQQTVTDREMDAFLKNWTTVRDRETLVMTATMIGAGLAPASVVPAESSFKAVTGALQVRVPHFKEIEMNIDAEAARLGLPPTDLKGTPSQNTTDVDFAALRKLDAAIKDGEEAAKKANKAVGEAAKSNVGLMVGGAIVLVLGGGVLAKVYL